MHRRTFLTTTAAGIAGTAGCLGDTGDAAGDGTPEKTTYPPSETSERTDTPSEIDSDSTEEPEDTSGSVEGPKHGDDLPPDEDPTDGYPPEFDEVPDERTIDTDSYEALESGVVLAPIEDAYYWYARREARFVDARSTHAYGESHVYGAVASPANGGIEDDPVESFPKDDRIVCYCGCPHHLSSMRAKDLMDDGYEDVFVIDEGFWEWHDRDYPLAGEDTDRTPGSAVLRGKVDPAFAGETAWARHEPTGQMEATDVLADGSYEMTLRFYGVSSRSPIAVETPAYEFEAPLGELTGRVITGP